MRRVGPFRFDEERVAAVLGRYMSPITAQAMARRAFHAAERGPRDEALVAQILRALEPGIRLFVEEGKRVRLLDELRALAAPRGNGFGAPCSIQVLRESDVPRARLSARDLCEQVGGGSLECHKVATAVSELARNQVQYAAGGVIELSAQEPPLRVIVRAIDHGPGIPQLAAVLAGRYQSRTGLGLGLLGVRRLALRFDAQSGAGGTTIEAEFAL